MKKTMMDRITPFTKFGLKLFTSLLIPLFVAVVSNQQFDMREEDWFEALNRPGWVPSDTVLPLMFFPLSLFLGISCFSVWAKQRHPLAGFSVYIPWGLMLLLHGVWNYVFFSVQDLLFATCVAFALILHVLWTMRSFYPYSAMAALFLVPYGLYVIALACFNSILLFLN